MINPPMQHYRFFLKDTIRKQIDFSKTDQNRGFDPPPIEKPVPDKAVKIDLSEVHAGKAISNISLLEAIRNRRSHRTFSNLRLTMEELSFLLWATQGIRGRIDRGHAYRNVPSAGCRHALETYLCVLNVERLETGVYRYLPLEHQLLFEFTEDRLHEKIVEAVFDQPNGHRP